MADALNSREVDFEEASSRLSEGLESCRSIVRNYRAMLGNPRSGTEAVASDLRIKTPANRSG